jgi:hypothetical protein
MMTSSNAVGEIPDRSIAALTAMPPSSVADNELNPPRNEPIGVRAAEIM